MPARPSLVGLLSFLLCLSGLPPVVWAEAGRLILDEENDSFASHADRHYTQGLEILYVSPSLPQGALMDRVMDGLAEAAPLFADGGGRRYRLGLGQSIFTPEDIHSGVADPTDRPYAGWLYGDFALMQENGGHSLSRLELQLGVVGPPSLAQVTQNDFHQFMRVGQAQGWSHQLQDEPGVMLSYDRAWRLGWSGVGGWGVDAVPQAGVTLGNVMTYASAGGLLRLGRGLGVDYGPAQIRPALSGGGWMEASRLADGDAWETPLGGYLFAGVQERAVAHNIFLDGNSFRDSPHVGRRVWVNDFSWGASAYWSDRLRLDFTVTDRGREFVGQHDRDRFGVIRLSFRL